MKNLFDKPWLLFSPFLAMFVLLVLRLHTDEMLGDESRYMMFAQNLLQGFYSPPDELNLWNGPGYPLLLVPFVALKLPLISITLFNAVLQYGSIVLLFKTLVNYTNRIFAFCLSLFWACYYISYQELPAILTEPLTAFLITLALFSLEKYFSGNRKPYFFLSGFAIGYLVLTKIIFGYVLLSAILIYAFLSALKFSNLHLKKINLVLWIAFATVLPYLIYTYSLTEKLFYFGNSGGLSLYWMSTPFENEYGDWNDLDFRANCTLPAQPCNSQFFEKNHAADMTAARQLAPLDRDDFFKKLAFQNIKNHPMKYLKNCFANQGRLWFGFPSSYFPQRDSTLLRLLPNSILLALLFFTLPLWLLNLRRCRAEVNFLFVFVLLYLAASTLVSAYPRQFYVVVPVILLWAGYLHFRLTKVSFRFSE